MAMKMTTNPLMLEKRLSQIGDRAVRGVSDAMRRAAIRIRDLARNYAPVKTGLLERSIDYAVIRDENRRNSYVIYIDLDAVKINGKGNIKELGEYALLMHAGLSPYGSGRYKLGERSVQKASSGKKVGGRFLARAGNEVTKELLEDAAHEVRRATRRGESSVGVGYRPDNNKED